MNRIEFKNTDKIELFLWWEKDNGIPENFNKAADFSWLSLMFDIRLISG